nr:hypothetical protein GCM10020092_049440 [Actinoplanes digitatis]
MEAARPQVGEPVQGRGGEQPRVQLRDAVDRRAADHGQVRHPDPLLRALRDDRELAQLRVVAGVAVRDLLQEQVVDQEDDLQVPRQQPPHQLDRPGLQRLGQQRVAGVRERAPGDRPGPVPVETLLVDEHPHQLGDRHDRVGVVELDHHLVGEVVPVAVAQPEAPHDVAQRAGDQEVLLLEAQLAAELGAVVRVQDLADVLRADDLLDRLAVLA